MGGAGSGGYKNSPGDVETHSAWTLIEPVAGGAQVMLPTHLLAIPELKHYHRNCAKRNASTATKRWLSTHLVKEPTSSPVKPTLMQ
jgi:hypothetical protein